MTITAALRRILLLFAPVAAFAAVALITLVGNLFFEWLSPERAMPYSLGLVVALFLLAIAGAVTAYVTLLLEPAHKIKVSLIMAVLWTGLLFYLLLMNGLVPGNQGNTTAELIAFKSLLLSLVACAGGLLVVYFFNRGVNKKAQKRVAISSRDNRSF
jgi:hypothetical protein